MYNIQHATTDRLNDDRSSFCDGSLEEVAVLQQTPCQVKMTSTVVEMLKKTNSQLFGPPEILHTESESFYKILSQRIAKTLGHKNSGNSRNANAKAKELEANDEEEEKKWGKYTGMLLAIMSSLVFSISALLVKYLPHYNPITIALWRFQGALWPALPFFIHHQLVEQRQRSNCKISISDEKLEKQVTETEQQQGNSSNAKLTSNWKIFALVTARSVLSCNALLLNFYSLKYLDIGDALVISSSTPIFVTLVAHKFLKEKCGLVSIVSAILTLVGVIIISRPPHLTGQEEFDFNSMIGTTLAFGCMILATISYAILRYIRTVHFSVTAVGFGFWGTLENLILAVLFGIFSLPSGMQDWLVAGGLVLLTFIGQVFVILAFKCEQAGFVALFKSSDVLFAFMWQILFLGRIPDQYSVIGSMIIVFCITLTAFRKWLNSLPANNSTRRKLSFILQ